MSFSIVIIPDTQIVTRDNPNKFYQMTRWIVEQAEALRIRAVLHVGDVTHNGADVEAEWLHAKEALSLIDQNSIPLFIAPGNHDYDNLLSRDRSLTMFNRYLGIQRYENKKWFGGSFGKKEDAENIYAVMEIDGIPFLFLTLEFGPRDEVLAWADEVLRQYQDHKAIIITHCFMYIHGERSKPGDAHNPKTYPGASGANDGEDLWQKCFRKHRNIIAVYSGHQVPANVSYRMDRGDNGNLVFQSFQNWQDAENGGEGRIRIVRFSPAENSVTYCVFNPQKNGYEHEEGYEISFPYDLSGVPATHDLTSFRYPKS